MDVNTVQTLITSVGFPIVVCLALGWFIYKVFERFTANAEKREEKLYTIIAEAQATNEKLLQTNSEFVGVLDAYKTDLVTIKNDVAIIKDYFKTEKG